GKLTIWIIHVVFATAFAAIIISSRLRDMDLSIEEAALDLGAPPLKVFFVIVLPIIAPALLSSWLLSFTLSMDDLVITSFVAGPGSTTLPMKVFSAARLGVSPKINAIGSIIVAGASFFVLISALVSFKMEKKRKKEAEQAFEAA
ncbi:MAG: ABC transporter permease subunit, partial [Deltaproteobacteria bacterium]|nr:ABC transporter permease subunit [Deltaproteobacteria bacterium]